MGRTVLALVGLAVFGALFAGQYYAPRNAQVREEGAPAYHLGPGDVKSSQLLPTVEGTPIVVELRIVGPPIDVYVMDRQWAATLPDAGTLDLSRPFSYRSEWSLVNVTGERVLTIVSDGVTSYNIVFDHTDNHYAGDAVPPAVDGARAPADGQDGMLAGPGDNATTEPTPDSGPPTTDADASVVSIRMTTRYEEQEARSLVLGYLAVLPSIFLVAITVWRRLKRRRSAVAGAQR